MAGDLTDLGTDVSTIQDVVRVLGAIRDRSAQDVIAPKVDGISRFSRLYTVITQNVLDTVEGRAPARAFRDPDFLTKLDLEFTRRYLTAIQAHEARDPTAPACWNVLFDRRRDQRPAVQADSVPAGPPHVRRAQGMGDHARPRRARRTVRGRDHGVHPALARARQDRVLAYAHPTRDGPYPHRARVRPR
jgi:hypothetical protein